MHCGRTRQNCWLISRILSISSRRRDGLIDVAGLPARLTMPLRRDGLDPVVLTPATHAVDSVRSIGPILGMKVWLVTDYEQARTILADPTYSTDIRSLVGGHGASSGNSGQVGTEGNSLIGGLGFTDPPEHTALRKILMPEFTARRLAALQPAVERIVEQQLDLMEAAGPLADIVEDLAFPVPFQVICELLGLPTEDRDRFRRLGHDRFDVQKGGAGMFGAISESREFMREAVSRQRRSPGNGSSPPCWPRTETTSTTTPSRAWRTACSPVDTKRPPACWPWAPWRSSVTNRHESECSSTRRSTRRWMNCFAISASYRLPFRVSHPTTSICSASVQFTFIQLRERCS